MNIWAINQVINVIKLGKKDNKLKNKLNYIWNIKAINVEADLKFNASLIF